MTKKQKLPQKTKDLPATIGIIHGVRDELKSRISELDFKVESKFKNVDARFNNVDAQFKKVDARFNNVDAQFKTIDARFNDVDAQFKKVDAQFDRMTSLYFEIKAIALDSQASIHRMEIMLEEQRAENKVVFENFGIFSNRMDRIEKRQDDHDLILTRFAKSKKPN